MIEVKHLTKRYGKHTAVDDISFTVQDGCIYGLLGPNGAGKSTTMNMITGYLAPTGGTVAIDGHDVQEEPKEAKACIGYLPEIPPLYTDMTVQEYLLFVSELKGKKKKADRVQDVAQAVQRAGLQEMEKRLIRNLSKGYRQRVGIAAALLGSPKVIILDEPTVGLDPAQMIEIRNLIHDLGETHTVILSSHILSEVQTICDRVLIIAHGKVAAQGTPEELAAQLAARGMIAATALGTKEQILAAAAKVEGLTDLRVTAEKGDEVSFTATSTAGADLRAALSKALAEAGCPVVSLTSDTMSLEDIFLQITETAPEEAQPEEPKNRLRKRLPHSRNSLLGLPNLRPRRMILRNNRKPKTTKRRKSEPCLPFLSGNCAAISPAWSAMLSLVLCWRLPGYITPPTAWCMARRIFQPFCILPRWSCCFCCRR